MAQCTIVQRSIYAHSIQARPSSVPLADLDRRAPRLGRHHPTRVQGKELGNETAGSNVVAANRLVQNALMAILNVGRFAIIG